MQYFDVEAKTWTPLESTVPSIEAMQCHYAQSVGSNLLVAGFSPLGGCYIYRYDIEGNVWERQSHSCGPIVFSNLCVIADYMYAISSNYQNVPQRYNFATRQWQSFAKVTITMDGSAHYSGATTFRSKVFVLYGNYCNGVQNAGLYCFDPVKNEWQVKATTCQPHFGSSLFVVNNKLYVAGGNISMNFQNYTPYGNPASVEVYNEESNTWSVVEQKHIPPNNLGAVEIEGRVYFIINKFPVDSGIRIPPEEVYPVPLEEWEKLGKIDKTAVLCYLPVKRESLKTE